MSLIIFGCFISVGGELPDLTWDPGGRIWPGWLGLEYNTGKEGGRGGG